MKKIKYFSLVCLLSLGYSNTYTGLFGDAGRAVGDVTKSASAPKAPKKTKEQEEAPKATKAEERANELALRKANETVKKTNKQLLISAVKNGNQKQVKEFLNKKGIDKDTLNKALMMANLNNQTEIAKILVDTGKLDQSEINKASLLGAAKFGNQKRLKKLLDSKGINTDTLSKAFMQAALNGQIETTKILLNTDKIRGTAKLNVKRALNGENFTISRPNLTPPSKKAKENADKIKSLIDKAKVIGG